MKSQKDTVIEQVVLSDACRVLPVKELSPSFRNRLSIELNPRSCDYNNDDVSKDWSGLAELMNFENQLINNFEIHSRGPTIALLDAYEKRKDSTVGKLWEYLTELERYDIIENEAFIQKLEHEVQQYNERRQETLQISTVSSCDYPRTVEEELERSHGIFDEKTIHAFVSSCKKDFPFVLKVLKPTLESMGFRLYIQEIDLIPGSNLFTITAEMIAHRCQKILLIMTQEYLKSPEFEFQHNIALSLSLGTKKGFIIPVVLEPISIPLVLRHISVVDNTRDLVKEFFWQKIKASMLTAPERSITLSEMAVLRAVDKRVNPVIKEKDITDMHRNTTAYQQPAMHSTAKEYNENAWPSTSNQHLQYDSGIARRNKALFCQAPYHQQQQQQQLEKHHQQHATHSTHAYQQYTPKHPNSMMSQPPSCINKPINTEVNDNLMKYPQQSQMYPCLDDARDQYYGNLFVAHGSNGTQFGLKQEGYLKQEDIEHANMYPGSDVSKIPTAPLLSGPLHGYEFNYPNPNVKVEAGIALTKEEHMNNQHTSLMEDIPLQVLDYSVENSEQNNTLLGFRNEGDNIQDVDRKNQS